MNLSRDKFLREQVSLDDGWVPFDILIRFNRLAQLSKDTDVIAKALHKSSSNLLEVSNYTNPICYYHEYLHLAFGDKYISDLKKEVFKHSSIAF